MAETTTSTRDLLARRRAAVARGVAVALPLIVEEGSGAVLRDHEFLKEPPRRVNFDAGGAIFTADALPKRLIAIENNDLRRRRFDPVVQRSLDSILHQSWKFSIPAYGAGIASRLEMLRPRMS